jgi:hypothetical protein
MQTPNPGWILSPPNLARMKSKSRTEVRFGFPAPKHPRIAVFPVEIGKLKIFDFVTFDPRT